MDLRETGLGGLGLRQPSRPRRQPADRAEVVGGQLPRRLAQPQAADEDVVARLVQVALRLVELRLRVQHVDVDANADLVAELRRLESVIQQARLKRLLPALRRT